MNVPDPVKWVRERLNGRELPGREAVVVVLVLALVAAPAVGIVIQGGLPVSGTVHLQTNSGATIAVTGASELKTDDPWLDDNRVMVVTDDGNATIGSTGAADATVASSELSGEWTNVTALDVSSNELYINPSDKPAANVSGDTDEFAFSDISATDNEPDFFYSGTSGTTTVTVRGVVPDIRIVATDQTGATLSSGFANDDGELTLSGMPNSDHTVTLSTQTGPYVSVADPDDEYIDNRNVDLNATVVDPQGDDFETVTIEKYNGNSWTTVTTETNHPSGSEINASITAHAGTNKWRVIMNATADRDAVSDTFTFRTPGQVDIYDASTGSLLSTTTVTGGLHSTTSNYAGVVTTMTGTADLNDATPPDENLRSEWSATGFENQSLVIDDVGANQTVVMYDSTAGTTYTQCFSVDDPTGTFTQTNSWVVVEQRIDGSWKVVGSDRFGVENEAILNMSDGVDYRVSLRNEDGDTRVLDGMTGDNSNGCIQLNVETAFGDIEDPDTVMHNVTCAPDTDTLPTRIQFDYEDQADKTSSIHFEVHEYRNESNVLVPNATFSGDFGSFAYTANVPAEQNETVWVVNVIAVRDGADNVEFSEVTCGRKDILEAAQWLITALFTGLIFVTAGLFSRFNGAIGGMVVAGMGAMFWFVGFSPPGLGGGVVALAMITAAILFVRETRSGGL